MVDGVKWYAPVDREFPAKLLPPPFCPPTGRLTAWATTRGDMPAPRGAHLPHSPHLCFHLKANQRWRHKPQFNPKRTFDCKCYGITWFQI